MFFSERQVLCFLSKRSISTSYYHSDTQFLLFRPPDLILQIHILGELGWRGRRFINLQMGLHIMQAHCACVCCMRSMRARCVCLPWDSLTFSEVSCCLITCFCYACMLCMYIYIYIHEYIYIYIYIYTCACTLCYALYALALCNLCARSMHSLNVMHPPDGLFGLICSIDCEALYAR